MGFSTQIINILANIINMDPKMIVIFKLKHIDLGAKFGKKNINMDLKIILSGL